MGGKKAYAALQNSFQSFPKEQTLEITDGIYLIVLATRATKLQLVDIITCSSSVKGTKEKERSHVWPQEFHFRRITV